MSEKEIEFNDREISPIQRFFIICSGADKTIIEQCPTEWNKYTGIGVTIFFTGLLAWLSGGYALYTVFRNTNLDTIDNTALLFAVPFGFLWGAVIFNLDRFIVSTFHKTDKGGFVERLGKELLQASPRILLATIIAITISKPIEIKIFESRLAEQIQRNEIAAKKNNIDDFNSIHGLVSKEGRVASLDTTITKLQIELTTDPQNVKDLINNDLVQANNELSSARNINNPKIKANENARYEIYRNSDSYIYTTDSLGNRINTGNYTQAARDRRYALYQEIQSWQKEIREKQENVTKINEQIISARALYQQQKTQEITDRKTDKNLAEEQLKTSTAIAEEEAKEANKISENAFTSNFITQLEALGDLTKITDKDDEDIRNKKRTMWWTSLVITLLFLIIELAPILTKLITKRGDYDEILDRVNHEKMIEQKEIISRKNSEISALVEQAKEAAQLKKEVKMQADKDKLDAELKNNKIILDTIAQCQQKLALLAIKKWHEEELAKINSDNVTNTTI